MRDIWKYVVTIVQNSKDLDAWIMKLGGYVTKNSFITGVMATETSNKVYNIY